MGTVVLPSVQPGLLGFVVRKEPVMEPAKLSVASVREELRPLGVVDKIKQLQLVICSLEKDHDEIYESLTQSHSVDDLEELGIYEFKHFEIPEWIDQSGNLCRDDNPSE